MAARILSLKKTLLHTPKHLLSPLASAAFFSSFCKNEQIPKFTLLHPPPVAKKFPFAGTAHGMKWQDPYHWMSENINDPDFTSYLNQENSYAELFMHDTEDTQRLLYSEMVSRIPSTVSTPPERWGSWFYYQCIPEGKEYPVLCRKPAIERTSLIKNVTRWFNGGLGEEQVLLDWNEIAEKHGYVHVGTCRVSPDHRYLAYTLDTSGNEQFQLLIKDLRSNSTLAQSRVEGVVSLAWAQDSRTLFYTLCDQNQRPCKVLCTKLGSDSLNDATIFTETDSRFCLDITSTKDGKFVTVNSNSRTSSEEGFCH